MSWAQMTKPTMDSYFGPFVAVAENWIIVGASIDDNINEIKAGADFAFTKMVSGIVIILNTSDLIVAAGGSSGDQFGKSV
jgi:hypothetical protein